MGLFIMTGFENKWISYGKFFQHMVCTVNIFLAMNFSFH